MLRLHTLGTLRLERTDRPATGWEVGQLPLAVLAMIAASGAGGAARDQLLAYFWPESDTQHARHALSQLLYALRRQLAIDRIVTGTDRLVLNSAAVACDLDAFHSALAAGDALQAAALHRGPFLDGFHLAGHGEFASWVEEVRARLHRQATDGLERALALAADRSCAIAITTELIRLDPYSSRHAIALMALHEAAIDPGAALTVLERHVAVLGHDLELPPPPAVVKHIERLRSQHGSALRVEVTPASMTSAPAPELPTRSGPSERRGRRTGRMLALLVMAVLILIAADQLLRRSGGWSEPQPIVATGGIIDAPADTDRSGRAASESGTTSWTALSFYREGATLMERGDFLGAFRMFDAAVREDSGFAVAAFWAFSMSELLGLPGRGEYLRLASRGASTAPLEARLYINGHVQAFGVRGLAAEAYADSALRFFAHRPQAHILAGQVAAARGDWSVALRHGREALELTTSRAERFPTGWRACSECAAVAFLADVHLWMDSLEAAEREVRTALRQHPRSGILYGHLAAILFRRQRGDQARAALDTAAQLSGLARPGALPEVEAALRDGRPDDAEALLQRLLPSVANPMLGTVRWLRVIALRNMGRRTMAVHFAREGRLPSEPEELGAPGWYEDPILEALARCEAGDHRGAAALFQRSFQRLADSQPDAGQRAWRMTHLATALAADGDTGRLVPLADSIERLGGRSLYGRDRRLHHYVRGLLESARGNDVAAVAHHRQAMYSPNEGYTRVNLELGRALLRLGRPGEAATVLAAALRGSLDASNLYVTRTELHEALAEAHDRAGARDSARVHYQVVTRAWADADPPVVARVARAHARLLELGSES